MKISKNSPNNLRVVFDTNIYIAALLKPGLADLILLKANRKEFDLIISQEIINELKNKLIQKFHFPQKEIKQFATDLKNFSQIVKIDKTLNVIKNDPADNFILETAVAGRANLIITLDRHLLKLKKYQNIGIIHLKTLKWIMPD